MLENKSINPDVPNLGTVVAANKIAKHKAFQIQKKKLPGLFVRVFANQKVATLISSLDRFFIKLPHLPKKIRLVISKVIPFLVLGLGIISLLTVLLSGFFMVLTIITGDITTLLESISGFLLVLLDTLFFLKAFKPLRQSNAIGWIYLFWAEILEVVNFIINGINEGITLADVGIGILTILISFYLLFEIGQFYVYKKNGEAV